MLKLALRILIVATIGYILATQFVSRSFSYLLEPITADLVYETLRGQMHALRTELDPQPPAEREAYLRDHIKPHYGLGLQIKTPAQAALTRAERDMVESTASSCGTTTTPFFRACPASRRSGWK